MTAYGSVMHHAIFTMEKLHYAGDVDALAKAHKTFDYYWEPENIHQVCEPVTIWAARETWAGLKRKAHVTIDLYYEVLTKDTGKLLALEVEFNLPFTLPNGDATSGGDQHTLHGTMDRLCLRKTGSNTYVNVEDLKTGQDYKFLRWNNQFSIYCWATTQLKFWTDAWGMQEGTELFTRFGQLARRGTWVSLRSGLDRKDAGWRGEQDYARMWMCVHEYVKAVEADIYPLSLKGDVCFYCQYGQPNVEGDVLCGGVAVPDKDHGAPWEAKDLHEPVLLVR
jgi:hypothetical protein